MVKMSIAERLESPLTEDGAERILDGFELAREITRLFDSGDSEGLLDLRDSYAKGIIKLGKGEERFEIVDGNLSLASKVGDLMREAGPGKGVRFHHAHYKTYDGPIAQFYLQTTGYDPSSGRRYIHDSVIDSRVN